MALTAGQIRRPRSSTAASRGLNDAEQSSGVADLCRQLISVSPFLRDDDCEEVTAIAGSLKRKLAESSSTKDVFRRGGGLGRVLEAVKELCKLGAGENKPTALPSANAVASLLSLLSAAFRGHRGNERYFADRLNGWSVLQTNLLILLENILDDSNDVQQVDRVVILLTGVLQLALGETDGTQIASTVESQRSKPGVPSSSDGQEAKIAVRGHEIVVQPQACALSVKILLRILKIETPGDDSNLLALTKSFFSHVHAVVGLCLRNRYALWETGITSHVLEVWLDHDTTEQCHDASGEIIETLKEFGLNELDDAALLFRRACESQEARSLLLTLLHASKAPAVVQFDLSQSGHSSVELKSLPRSFPPTTGYSLAAWFRFDEFDSKTHTTLFGAFDETQTCFLLAYLERDSRSLILQTSIRS